MKKTASKHKDSLELVRKHQANGWCLGADCDVDYREFKIVADDLKRLAGRSGYTKARQANELCRKILPVAAQRLDVLGMHICMWQKMVRQKYGDITYGKLQDIMAERYQEGCPTIGDTRAAARELRKCSNDYTEELILGEVFPNRDFVGRLEEVMNQSARVIEMAIDWLALLIRSICESEEGQEEEYEAL